MIKVVYSEKQVASGASAISPSAIKPKLFAEYLKKSELNNDIEFIEPFPLIKEDFYRCHSRNYVDGIFEGRIPNGFGNYSADVIDSLPYTSGAMYTAAEHALSSKSPVCALVSGFHHAGYNGYQGLGYFCTFNGLMATVMKLQLKNQDERVMIVDCDAHWGNGTDDIIDKLGFDGGFDPRCPHFTFGKYYTQPSQRSEYLNAFDSVRLYAEKHKPTLILYQSGADVHVDDPIPGGMLTEDEMMERDRRMFKIAKDLDIPIAWNLAGGYQRDLDGGCSYVLHLHLNTFKVVKEVYG